MRWRWRTGGDIVGRAAVDERRVMFVSLDNILRALDRESGVQQWRRPLAGRPTSGPQIVDDMVLVSGVSPVLRAFNIGEGRQSVCSPPWRVRGSTPCRAAALAVGAGARRHDRRRSARRPLAGHGTAAVLLRLPPSPLLPGPEQLDLDDVLPPGDRDNVLPMPDDQDEAGAIDPSGIR